MSDSAPVMWMRAGTSKGAFFLADDLPDDPRLRDAFLLRIMGSPDRLQIDGMGGADPLTSKVAVVQRSKQSGVAVDYLFLQVFVDQPVVSDGQNCGNILAGIAPFAIERGLVKPEDPETEVIIRMSNTGQIAVARVATPAGQVSYAGSVGIDGVPGTASPISLQFCDIAGSVCGSLLPTGNVVDEVGTVACTLIDNGMPCVVLQAVDVGATGYESRDELDAADELKARIEAIRLTAGRLMNLGDVTAKSVPKMMLVAPPRSGGAVTVRSFIPWRAHASVGVFGALTVATACLMPGSPAANVSDIPDGSRKLLGVEHPSGSTSCIFTMGSDGTIGSAAIVRTARKLMDGRVFA